MFFWTCVWDINIKELPISLEFCEGAEWVELSWVESYYVDLWTTCAKQRKKSMIFDFVGSIFMSQNDNGRKPNFLFSCRRGQVSLMGWQGLVGCHGVKLKNKIKNPKTHCMAPDPHVCLCVCVCACSCVCGNFYGRWQHILYIWRHVSINLAIGTIGPHLESLMLGTLGTLGTFCIGALSTSSCLITRDLRTIRLIDGSLDNII